MEKITNVLFFIALLHSIKTNDYEEYDMQLELKRVFAKLTALNLDFQRLQRKQQAMQRRLNNFHTDLSVEYLNEISKKFEQIENAQDTPRDVNNENYNTIKNAFLSEKKYLRRMIRSWEQKFETGVFLHNKHENNTVRFKEIEMKITQQASRTFNLSLQLDFVKENLETVANFNEERIDTIQQKVGVIDDLKTRVDSMSSGISSLILSSNKKISFSAVYEAQEGFKATIFKSEHRIIFKIVVHNDGNGYNETTGIFTVPVAGVYQFIFFVQGWHLGDTFTCPDAIVALYIDGKVGAAAVADARHDKQFETGGNTYINYFNKGQTILVGTANTCEKYIIAAYRTTFSGHLLY